MRIIQVITIGHELYGAQKHVLDLSQALAKHGHKVLVVVGSLGRLSEELEKAGVAVKHIPSLQRSINPKTDWRCLSQLRQCFAQFKPDLVASHSTKAGILARVACYLDSIPNTFTAHGWSFESGVPFLRRNAFRLIEKFVGMLSCKIITCSEIGKEFALDAGVGTPQKIQPIHYGVDDLGKDFPRNKQNVFTMTMVAGFREQKDHTTFLNALAKLKHLDWQVFLLGEGSLLPDAKQLVKDNHLENRIFFEGAVSDVPRYLSMTDLQVLITNWEGLPISILEGLSFSLPSLASDVSGVREEVIHDYNGLTVPQADVDATAAAIETLISNPDRLADYSNAARALFEKNFTFEAMFSKTLALYEELAGQTRPPAQTVAAEEPANAV